MKIKKLFVHRDEKFISRYHPSWFPFGKPTLQQGTGITPYTPFLLTVEASGRAYFPCGFQSGNSGENFSGSYSGNAFSHGATSLEKLCPAYFSPSLFLTYSFDLYDNSPPRNKSRKKTQNARPFLISGSKGKEYFKRIPNPGDLLPRPANQKSFNGHGLKTSRIPAGKVRNGAARHRLPNQAGFSCQARSIIFSSWRQT
ncbi:MAG: hypothetical protein BWY80_00607 [Firmicutes bacterium ADurb.Bin456]|nr:MAG: hypothetical protein BWY80_00607 [Firmicutes bacterium ADurb.Bin456]